MGTFFYKINNVIIVIFAFSLTYLYWDPLGIRSTFTITKAVGLLYALLSLFYWKRSFAIKKHNKKFIFTLVLYWVWVIIIYFVSSEIYIKEMDFNLTLFQLIILFWLVNNDIKVNPKLRNRIYLGFILGVFSASILLSLGVGVQSGISKEVGIENVSRVYFFGMNPNAFGNLAAIGILLTISLLFSKSFPKLKYLLIFIIPSLLTVIGLSGSRGAFLTVFIGIIVFFLFNRSSFRTKLLYTIIGVITGIFIYKSLMEFENLQSRIFSTLNYGDSGGRFEIWKGVIDLIYQYPIFGVGVGYNYEILNRLGIVQDPHNMFLFILATTGLVGFFIFIYFLINLFKTSFFDLKYNNDTTSLMIFVALIFITFKSGGIIQAQYLWMFYACISVNLLNLEKNNKKI